ncbi:MAG: Lrp/AsnC family transcriptional regulator [Candidatus Micrarchaeota archaeon]|nr:Lrp/AsnC family transcriptional regulator [Candidatus Micrarchaeota archaeon]
MNNIMGKSRLDDTDFAILDALQGNARQSIFQIAKKIAIPPTTIHNRIKKLRGNGIITGYTININREKIGQNVCALVLVYLNNNELEPRSKKGGLARLLLKNPNIAEVFETAGNFDLIVKVYGQDIKDITRVVIDEIREIKGVEKTETIIALSEQSRF